MYQECLCLELREAGIAFESQVIMPVVQSPSGIILSKTKGESSSVGISPDRNMVREHQRESAQSPSLIRAEILCQAKPATFDPNKNFSSKNFSADKQRELRGFTRIRSTRFEPLRVPLDASPP